MHSYAVRDWTLVTNHLTRAAPGHLGRHDGEPFVAAVENGPLWATQFHPEKSGDAGAAAAAQLDRRTLMTSRPSTGSGPASNCSPPSTSATARPSGSCRASPAPRPPTATRSRPPCAWQAPGAEWLHLVDLDAAFGTGDNRELLAEVVGTMDIKVELSGGIRDDDSLAAALATGCRRVNLGTAALETPEWFAKVIAEHGDRIAVGLDVRGTTLRGRGWTRDGGDLYETLARLDSEGCARYVVTDIDKDGTLEGPNLDLLRNVCAATDRPVVASGGVSSLDDLARSRAWSPTASRGRSSARRCTRGVHPRGGARAHPGRPMTLAVRVIPCLDVDAGRVVKGVNFQNLRDAGDPVELARAYDAEGADELTFLDITASHEDRETTYDVVRRTAEQVFIPLTVGGGVSLAPTTSTGCCAPGPTRSG